MTQPLRSLLLTFNQLAPDALMSAVGTGTVTLSQHYRQSSEWDSIAGGPFLSDHPSPGVKLVVISNHPEEIQNLPLIQEIQSCSGENAFSFVEQYRNRDLQPSDTLWVHVDNAAAYSSDQVSRFVSHCQQIRSKATLFAVSAFRTHFHASDHKFDVLVDEDHLRVPAIIQHPEFSTFHSQTLTSSFDLLSTLMAHAGRLGDAGTMNEASPAAESEKEPRDLWQLAIDPGSPWNRSLKIEFGSVRALRNLNFLYAAQLDVSAGRQTVLREGLFAKPQDRWNVLDVSSEFVESTDLMRAELKLS